ncbi:MAG: 4'-phosphopantetheinyl transferase superfamily protein [Clostridia bacterium]|nr:4'-phosphopantetheinyl transferase superfamily protein [Clostridia bacterium]
MTIVRWAPITETGEIPPMGDELDRHLYGYKGAVRHSSCSAWNLLYSMLKEKGLPTAAVSFSETGKPFLVGSDIYFSLSHSKDICAVAIADCPVGVDVEKCRDGYNPLMVGRSLSGNELAVFDGDFTRIWCRKEAVAKMTGEGITGYPDYIDTCDPGYCFTENTVVHNDMKYWLVTASENR